MQNKINKKKIRTLPLLKEKETHNECTLRRALGTGDVVTWLLEQDRRIDAAQQNKLRKKAV